MNSTILLTETQETNRITKGYELYINRLIEKLNDTEYLVNGKYLVTIFDKEDILSTCECMDWKHRINMIDTDNTFRCKHQIAIEFLLMDI